MERAFHSGGGNIQRCAWRVPRVHSQRGCLRAHRLSPVKHEPSAIRRLPVSLAGALPCSQSLQGLSLCHTKFGANHQITRKIEQPACD